MRRKKGFLICMIMVILVFFLMATEAGAATKTVKKMSAKRYEKLLEYKKKYYDTLMEYLQTIEKISNDLDAQNATFTENDKVKSVPGFSKAINKAINAFTKQKKAIIKYEKGGVTKAVAKATKKLKAMIESDIQYLKKTKGGTLGEMVTLLNKWVKTAEKDAKKLDNLMNKALKPVTAA